jgi:hypothetical protein
VALGVVVVLEVREVVRVVDRVLVEARGVAVHGVLRGLDHAVDRADDVGVVHPGRVHALTEPDVGHRAAVQAAVELGVGADRVHRVRVEPGFVADEAHRERHGVLGVAAAARAAALRVGQPDVARVHELDVVERGVRHPVDGVVGELVEPRAVQEVEVRRGVVGEEEPVADLRRGRHVRARLPEAGAVAAVAVGALQVVGGAEAVRVADAGARVVVRVGPVVALHTRLDARRGRRGAGAGAGRLTGRVRRGVVRVALRTGDRVRDVVGVGVVTVAVLVRRTAVHLRTVVRDAVVGVGRAVRRRRGRHRVGGGGHRVGVRLLLERLQGSTPRHRQQQDPRARAREAFQDGSHVDSDPARTQARGTKDCRKALGDPRGGRNNAGEACSRGRPRSSTGHWDTGDGNGGPPLAVGERPGQLGIPRGIAGTGADGLAGIVHGLLDDRGRGVRCCGHRTTVPGERTITCSRTRESYHAASRGGTALDDFS